MHFLWLSLFILGCGLSGLGHASCVAIAKMVAVEGQVSIKPHGKVMKVSPGTLPRELCAGDEVHTFEGRALINDGHTRVAVDQFSVAAFNAVGKTALNQGQALFEVRRGMAAAGVEVKTRLSVIGVKGTLFLVGDIRNEISVVLDRGMVEIVSSQGPVELYRESPAAPQTQADFASYARQQAAGLAAAQVEFEQYKQQIQREFVAYVESMKLQAGKELVTVGRSAIERNISRDSARMLKSLSEWAGIR